MTFVPISWLAWAALVANLYVYSLRENSMASAGMLVLPAAALAATLWAGRHLPEGKRAWVSRLGWWTVTLPLWVLVILIGWARWEARWVSDEYRAQLLSMGGLMVVAGYLMLRGRGGVRWRTFAEAGAVAILMAAVVAAYAWFCESRTRQVVTAANARWKEIGRPMAEFERTLKGEAENASLGTLKEILQQQFESEVYKPKEGYLSRKEMQGPGAKARQELDAKMVEEISRVRPPSDVVAPAKESVTDSRRAELDAAYAKILGQEAPIWAWNPQDSFGGQEPNFVGLRKMAQLVVADAGRRIELGDVEGAVRATQAMHRVTEKLDTQPRTINLMIGVAVDSLLAHQEVRLPAEPDAFAKLAADATRQREMLARSYQFDVWCYPLDFADGSAQTHGLLLGEFAARLPKWAQRFTADAFIFWHANSLANAEIVGCLTKPETLALPDLGSKEMEAIAERHRATFAPNAGRASMRLNGTLLLREQVELIRWARQQMAAGQPLEPRASVVLPQLRWIFTPDAAARTVALKLEKVPAWLVEGGVTPPDFWVLPLDGSKAWQFGEIRRTAAQ